jgi:membrane fusion protein
VAIENLFRPEVAEARRQRVHGEIVLTQPVRTQTIVLLICVIAALLVAWVVLGSYARTEVARGILVTDTASAKVVAIRPGLITEMLVREGDVVRAGEKLAVVRIEQAAESGRSTVGESLGAIEAQRGLTERQAHLASEREASERVRIAATLSGLRQQASDVDQQIALQEQTVQSAQSLVQRIEAVVEKGFVSRIEIERRRQALIAARQDLARLRQQRNGVDAQAAAEAADLARAAVDRTTAVVSARASAEGLVQRRAELEGDRAYLIVAPIAGRVATLQAATGRTVDPGFPMMEIVPESSALHAEIYAPTRAIGFVRPGQEVRLLYDAFPYQRFGSFTGRVKRVSSTVLDPRQLVQPLKIEEPVYRIEVSPADQKVEAFGEHLPLQPGMTVTANMILERRSFLDWLLEPLRAVLWRNG